MEIRTENLTILFVDIAGFTVTTSRQSRAQNAKLLATFDKTLLPLIKRFKGSVVKSIGDALLITFRSPTDAMLCSMALQDAMHEHNLRVDEDEKIHIRVAANLGEVRVTKKDIFGEPVNVASRIEGITPADEIYLSEAVYMAMNKAEVPAKEVGYKELSGVAQSLRIYGIPRFATHRLIPEQTAQVEQGSEILYPYGGMHQRAPQAQSKFTKNMSAMSSEMRSSPKAWIGAAVVGAIAVVAYIASPGRGPAPAETVALVTPAQSSGNMQDAAIAPPPPSNMQLSQPVVTATPAAVAAPQTTALIQATPAAAVADSASVSTAPATAAKAPVSVEKPAAAANIKPQAPSWNVYKAKLAYKAGRITKPEYRAIVERLEMTYENRIRDLKMRYRAGKISETYYEQQVRQAKMAYKGN